MLDSASCTRAFTALAAAYSEMGWLFWLFFLDTICVAIACCQWLLQTICNGSRRIWSASSEIFCRYIKSAGCTFHGQVNSHFSMATAFAMHTLANAMRLFTALLWLLMVYPLTPFVEVRLLLLNLPTCHCLLPDKVLCGCKPMTDRHSFCRACCSLCERVLNGSPQPASSQLFAGGLTPSI